MLERADATLKRAKRHGELELTLPIVGRFLAIFVEADVLEVEEVVTSLSEQVELSSGQTQQLRKHLELPAARDVSTEVEETLGWWCQPGELYELRGIGEVGNSKHVVYSMYSRSHGELAAAAEQLSGKLRGIYLLLNPVKENLSGRVEKGLFRPGNGECTSSGDIDHRMWLLIDSDPQRAKGMSGQSATVEEKLASFVRAFGVWYFLWQSGWPHPVVADSGNGAHLRYKVELPEIQGNRVLSRYPRK